ncbi:MAG: branched-chain amino acid ABC transporter permease [Firmicutes bacterium]|nr:branched-chain amino acid ABC transporter permease [Bacillota bacterium]
MYYLVNGLPIGAIYALVALGYSLIYASAGVLNWSQGDMVMLGAFIGYNLHCLLGLNFILALLITTPAVACIGMLVERIVLRSLRKRSSPPVNVVIGTLGVAIICRNLALAIWGPDAQLFRSPVGSVPVEIGTLRLFPQDIFILILGIALMILLQYFLKYTREGKALRAVAQDRMAASLMGIDVGKSDTLAFAASAAMGAVAGILIAPLFFVTFNMGAGIGLKGFVAAVVGGLGNIPGAIGGGFFLGLIESFASGKISSGYRDAIAFTVLILILWLKPAGLFSKITKETV